MLAGRQRVHARHALELAQVNCENRLHIGSPAPVKGLGRSYDQPVHWDDDPDSGPPPGDSDFIVSFLALIGNISKRT